MAMRRFLFGVLLLMSSLVVACGISQDQHDAVLSDLSTAQQELQSVKAELEAAQGKVSEVTSSLEKARTELKTTQAELEAAKSELETAQADLKATQDEYKAFKLDLESSWISFAKNMRVNTGILGINAAGLIDEREKIPTSAATITGALANLNDPELKALWEEAYKLEGGRWDLYFRPFERFMAANNARMIKKGRAVGAKLTE